MGRLVTTQRLPIKSNMLYYIGSNDIRISCRFVAMQLKRLSSRVQIMVGADGMASLMEMTTTGRPQLVSKEQSPHKVSNEPTEAVGLDKTILSALKRADSLMQKTSTGGGRRKSRASQETIHP